MLSICTTIKNRSRVLSDNGTLFLFPNCIESVAKSLSLTDDVELVISDWESTDWDIREWIEDKIPHIPIHIITVKADGFSAGKGRNISADHANGDILFFMDADMIINKEVISHGINEVTMGNVYYPTVKYEVEQGGKQIIHEGGGNVFMSKEVYLKAGKWPCFWEFGFEDTDFANKIKSIAPVVVNDNISIFHQWHPQTKLFKNQYSTNDTKVDEREQFYKNRERKREKDLIKAIELMLGNNPNTTHSSLNNPVKGNNGELIL